MTMTNGWGHMRGQHATKTKACCYCCVSVNGMLAVIIKRAGAPAYTPAKINFYAVDEDGPVHILHNIWLLQGFMLVSFVQFARTVPSDCKG